ncbi:protein PBDC1 [Bacillus rossius redtenbacheri]|uniref:protein PBDC1 n=1 Tax=Bacillus rossius redtenbacheri TaxID=93214 RepID=UPI002FDEED7D
MALAGVPDDVGPEGMLAAAGVLSRPAEEFENDPSIEALWAMRAVEHAEVYFNILCSVDPRLLRLTPHDDTIYREFREEFPDLQVAQIPEDDLKSPEAKQKWRPFCERFQGVIEDYNLGTLLRLDGAGEYSEQNTVLVTRIQFYAVELARNREGVNDGVRDRFKPRGRQGP